MSDEPMDSPRTPLDVELLAEAMAATSSLVYYGTDDPVDWQAEAEAVAAEYLRLQSTDPSPGEPNESAPFPHPDEE